MKKKALVFLLLALMMVLAVACGGKGTPPPAANSAPAQEAPAQEAPAQEAPKTGSEEIVINYLTIKNADHPIRKALDEMVAEYNAKTGSNIRIEYSTTADRASYEQKLRTQIASKNVPDWFDSDPNAYSRKLAESGYLADVGAFLDAQGLRDRIQPMALSYQTFDGLGTYLLPTAVDVEVFWYNIKIFADNGLVPPETWDDFLAACGTLKAAGVTCVSVSGKEQWPMLRYLAYIPFRLANNDWINKAKVGDASFGDDIGMQGINLLYTLGTNGYLQEGFATTDYGSAIDYFVSGKAAIFNMGSWQFSSFTAEGLKGTAVEGQIDYFLLPTVEGAVNSPSDIWSSGGVGIAFNKDTFEDKTAGFLKYMLSEESGYTEKVYRNGPIFSAILSDEIIESADPLYNKLTADIANIKIGGISWDVLVDPVTNSLLGDLSNALALGTISPEEFAAKIDASVKENAPNYFNNSEE